MTPFPDWMHTLAMLTLSIGVTCAVVIALDELRHPQHMAVMYLVWPLTALFGGLLWLWGYYRYGRGQMKGGDSDGHGSGHETPMPAAAFKGASHCGAGCTLGDIVAEWAVFAIPSIAVWFGYGSLFAERTFAVWVPDFILAFLIGIGFQYFAIKPMRDLTVRQGLWQAVKADTASLTSWQVGMYGAMATLQFAVLRPLYGQIAPVDSPEFWFVMQIAMVVGFVVAYPVNWWLIRNGTKEKM